ncbi:Hint domain-containing protein [Shimia sp.]|uniref:Hint domain-containing protein n=1 Tax=Shimia sp. TaxID=1954381 RepID=UPI00329766BC
MTRRKPAPDDLVLTGAGCGLIQGTQVGTRDGWVPVETLVPGAEVLTFDAGFQTMTSLIRDVAWDADRLCPRTLWPLNVPAGTLENRDDLLVMPHQGVLIECEDVSDPWGDPYAIVPGAALDVLAGVERQELCGEVEVFLPVFEEDQVVFANHGLLLFCQSHWGVRDGKVPTHATASNYNMLPIATARVLLEMGVMSDDVLIANE